VPGSTVGEQILIDRLVAAAAATRACAAAAPRVSRCAFSSTLTFE
jgi:hypothetical protein